ncbi:MAG TPA: hypothetical protein DD435_06450, partial [Cyanobacteria bacterium UBA8530]|nr:hypothetical protein [Cyanobacteria bacterium UBA8530]
MKKSKLSRVVLAWALVFTALPVRAEQVIPVVVGRSSVVTVKGLISKVSIADPQIADVAVLSKSEVLVNAKKTGTTTLVVWSSSGKRFFYDIAVRVDTKTLKDSLDREIGTDQVSVQLVNENVILTGQVAGPRQSELAEKLAAGFANKVINLLQTAEDPQVKVDVQVVEISKNDASNLGVKWGSLRLTPTGDAIFSPDRMVFAEPRPGAISEFSQFDRLSADLNLLVKQGKAKILSNPSLVAVSGGKA